jgi:hypothetical protein
MRKRNGANFVSRSLHSGLQLRLLDIYIETRIASVATNTNSLSTVGHRLSNRVEGLQRDSRTNQEWHAHEATGHRN